MDPEKKKKIKKILYFSLIGVFALVFVISAGYIISYLVGSGVESNQYNELSELVNNIRNEQGATTDSSGPNTDPSGSTGENTATGGILPEYQPIYELNPDMVGWIKIPDTNIDYPVMQSPGNKDYYLYHNFNKEWSRWGAIYARDESDIFTPSDNVTLYGHYKWDSSMFTHLHKFGDKSFWETHKTFTFDTLYERHTYEIIAVFKTSAIVGEGFAYHKFSQAANEEEFNTYISTVKSLQFYETGVTAEYGDMLLTLSTCEYTLTEGRLVVVAKRIS